MTGVHVSPAVYRARRRLVAVVAVTVLLLTATAVHRLVSARGADEVTVADRNTGAAGTGPAFVVVVQPSAGPTAPARSTTTPAATANAAPGATAPAVAATTSRPARSTTTSPAAAARASSGPTPRPDDPTLPASGTGRRVVYSIGHQRVWLVTSDGRVARSHRVSGARQEYVEPGTFHVFSAFEKAIAWDHESTMRWMVRFAKGPETNIGFHEIPVMDDTRQRAQTAAQLGTPLSDGCIRQDTADARTLFDFAPVGTKVVVTA